MNFLIEWISDNLHYKKLIGVIQCFELNPDTSYAFNRQFLILMELLRCSRFRGMNFREWPVNYDFAGINFRERPKTSRNRKIFYPRNFHFKVIRISKISICILLLVFLFTTSWLMIIKVCQHSKFQFLNWWFAVLSKTRSRFLSVVI